MKKNDSLSYLGKLGRFSIFCLTGLGFNGRVSASEAWKSVNCHMVDQPFTEGRIYIIIKYSKNNQFKWILQYQLFDSVKIPPSNHCYENN
jgi:hypothetical protein